MDTRAATDVLRREPGVVAPGRFEVGPLQVRLRDGSTVGRPGIATGRHDGLDTYHRRHGPEAVQSPAASDPDGASTGSEPA